MDFFSEIISILKNNKLKGDELTRLKIALCSKYGIKKIPTGIEILLHASQEDLKHLSLVTKPTRTISGVAVVALMTSPISCPHGRCIYCPGGPGSVFGDTPQSYTGKEPSTMRAIRAGYDSYTMVFNRLEQYVCTGHNLEKVELVVQGGTFPSFDIAYQENFIGYGFKALNDFSRLFFSNSVLNFARFKEFFELPGDVKNAERTKKIHEKIRLIKGSLNLESEQKKNEISNSRCVALCIETRPDFCREEHVDEMLKLGTTRVELGVQTVYDEVLRKVNRGHSMKDTYIASQLLKDSFLKVGFHMMPGLPSSSKERDLKCFKELFENPGLKPDNLKIYPCMVMPGTQLYDDWKNCLFNPISTKEAAEIIVEAKKFIPEYCRVMRVQRDIPTFATSAGVDRTNLRQYVEKLMREKNVRCRCIRCREPKSAVMDFESVKIAKKEYESSGGTEIFLSAETADFLLGFCRLRIPFKPFRKEITSESAGIRELHVYGRAAGLKMQGSVQHRGLGKALLSEAERIAKEDFGKKKLLVISGIGAKEYYRKLGYKDDGVYVSKQL